MGKNDIDALLDFYLFSDLGDEKAVTEYLEEEELDFNSFYDELGTVLKKKKAELKVTRGKKRIEKYLNELKKLAGDITAEGNTKQIELAYAFHKLHSELSEKEVKEIMEESRKLAILQKIIESDE
ncbi:MAG: hypothetical protein PVF17_13985 [Ignavibacteria bacterium]|jgi:hypothetical protein